MSRIFSGLEIFEMNDFFNDDFFGQLNKCIEGIGDGNHSIDDFVSLFPTYSSINQHLCLSLIKLSKGTNIMFSNVGSPLEFVPPFVISTALLSIAPYLSVGGESEAILFRISEENLDVIGESMKQLGHCNQSDILALSPNLLALFNSLFHLMTTSGEFHPHFTTILEFFSTLLSRTTSRYFCYIRSSHEDPSNNNHEDVDLEELYQTTNDFFQDLISSPLQFLMEASQSTGNVPSNVFISPLLVLSAAVDNMKLFLKSY